MRPHVHARFWIACLVLGVACAGPALAWAQPPTTLQRGLTLATQGKYAEALDVFTQAIADNPKGARAYRERARCRIRLNDLNGALADYNEAVTLEPGNASGWSGRGTVKRRLKDLDGAWADITHALEIAPNDAGALNNRGLVRYDRGDYQGALADYTRSIELDPKQGSAFNNRGLVKVKLGDRKGALADYDQSITNDPRDPNAFANRGVCHNALGNPEAARQDFQRALGIFPAHANALSQLKKLDAQAVSKPLPVVSGLDRGADADVRDPVAASATSDLTFGDVRVSVPLEWTQKGSTVAAGGSVVSVDQVPTPYKEPEELLGIQVRKEAAIAKQNPGVEIRRDEVMLGGVPVARWTWKTPDNRTLFEYALRSATSVYTVRVEAAGAVQVEPAPVRQVLDTITVSGLAVDLALEPHANDASVARESPEGLAPPVWKLDKEASRKLLEPCGPGGEPETEPPPPPPLPASPPDLTDLHTTLARSIDRLDRTRYGGAVAAAMQATRILMGPLTPEQEQRLFAAWAPLFDFPSDNVIAYLEKLNPLLVEFVALVQGVQAADAGLEQAQYEAEMAAAYDHEAGTRTAMATAMRFVAELKDYKGRINGVAARVAALGEPPDPMKDKCDARTRTKKALEFLKTLPPLPTPDPTSGDDGLTPEFRAKLPPSEVGSYRGKGYWYWLDLPSKTTPDSYSIHLNGTFHVRHEFYSWDGKHVTDRDGFALTAEIRASDIWWDGHTFQFSKTDPDFGSWTCPSPGQSIRAGRSVIRGTISDDGKAMVTLDVTSTYRGCRQICTHGPERISTSTGEHSHRLSGEDTAYVQEEETVYRAFTNLPLVNPRPIIGGGKRGAVLEYAVRGPGTAGHIRELTPYGLTPFDASDGLSVMISSVESSSGAAASTPKVDPEKTARDEQIAFHQENIRLLEDDLARYSDQLARAADQESRTFSQYMITGKAADLQAEKDAITTIETGNFTRTMTAWDGMVQGQMAAQSREMAATTAAGATIYGHVDRLIDNLPEAGRAKTRAWARDQIYGAGDRGENAKRVARMIAEQLRDVNTGLAKASLRDAMWNDDVVANLEMVQTVANYSMYATPFVSGGGAVALAYGMLSGTVSGYQTGGHLGETFAGTFAGTTLSAVTTAARFWSPMIDYGLTFYEGYVALDESGEQGGFSGAAFNVAETWVKRKIVETGTKALVGYQTRLDAARKAARLDAWRDAQRRVTFRQEREYGQALVEQHNSLYNQYKSARQSGADPAQVQRLQTQLMDSTAAIKQSPHAKGYLKFDADQSQRSAYASTDRLHTAQVLRDFKRDLAAEGMSLSGLKFKPIRNAGNTSPGMDLDMAVFTDLKRITYTDPTTKRVTQIPLYQANGRMQKVFDRTYARNSGGRTARASWQMVTTSKNLEAYEDMGWINVKKTGRNAGLVNPLRPGVTPIDPLSALDPRYAEGAARVTEIKADEMSHQIGMSRDNRNWETYRGTSKDIKTKILPLISERLKDPKLTSSQRQQIMQKYEFYKKLSGSMDLANYDPVAAEHALNNLTGHQGADLTRMVSMGLEALGKFR